MANELIINASLPETRVALVEDGEIQELLIERASGKGIVGNIYKGRVTRVLPGMQAAFVDIGLEKAAFLYVDDVHVHSEIFDEEEGGQPASEHATEPSAESEDAPMQASAEGDAPAASAAVSQDDAALEAEARAHTEGDADEEDFDIADRHDHDEDGVSSHDERDDSDEGEPEHMSDEGEQPEGTIAPSQEASSGSDSGDSSGGSEGGSGDAGAPGTPGNGDRPRRGRRGRRGGRFRRKGPRDQQDGGPVQASAGPRSEGQADENSDNLPEEYQEQIHQGEMTPVSDRSSVQGEFSEAPTTVTGGAQFGERSQNVRKEFKENRGRDKRIRSKASNRGPKPQVNIQDLLKEGDEVLVQVAKDPIATKGARLTCHISLPGRHLVCMPTIDHVGVSRRIERDDERRRLREYVERHRPKKLGFIVRTASGKQGEKRVEIDMQYLSSLWDEIKDKAGKVQAPALVYEDLNPVLRAIRDWVTEDIDKIVVDSRYHHNDILRFTQQLMPQLRSKVELYQGDIPIFDAYGISSELARALERKVWLKSGGYIVVDQAEALVAIDVNTGRYVGKKSLEDTILKTNLEAVQEIAYQLRLRNCGGIIILDLIDMEKDENKQRVYRALEEALKKDRSRPNILKISELGLVEMTRKRTRDTIVRALCESCSHCEGKGFIKSKQTVAYEVLREIERSSLDRDSTKILVQANAEVIDVLAIEERETIDQLERRLQKQVYLQAVGDYHPEQFEVVGDKKPRKDAGQAFNERLERGGRGDRRPRGRGGRNRDGGRDNNNNSGGGDRQERGDRNRNDRGGGNDRNRGGGRNHPAPVHAGPPVISPAPVRINAPAPVSIHTAPVSAPQNGDEDFERQPNFGSGDHPSAFASEYSGNTSDSMGNGNGGAPAPRADLGDFESEEDRQAFLRAQATQDAAIARMGANGNGGQPNGNRGGYGRNNGGGRGGQGNGNGGGRNGGRGRRGGRGGRGGGRDGRGFGQGAGPSGGGNQGRYDGGYNGNRGGSFGPNSGPRSYGPGQGNQSYGEFRPSGSSAGASSPVSAAPSSGGSDAGASPSARSGDVSPQNS